MNRHIFLVGIMGCGKSSLGRKVAANLQMEFMDMDQKIVELTGCASVEELFKRYGEQCFRNAETNLLLRLTQEPPMLIATGGGAVMRRENRGIMRSCGIIVLVDRPLEQIKTDIKTDRRPLLKEKGVQELDRIWTERMPTYQASADVVLDNSQGYYAGVSNLTKIVRMLSKGEK